MDQEKALEKAMEDGRRLVEELAENSKKQESLKAEIAKEIISDIKKKVQIYGITVDQIFNIASSKKVKKAKLPSKIAEFLYRSDKGEGWTGGRGRVPDWVKSVKEAGEDIEKYRINK